jgi:hypothetical protein
VATSLSTETGTREFAEVVPAAIEAAATRTIRPISSAPTLP